jgi:hypothetical protein
MGSGFRAPRDGDPFTAFLVVEEAVVKRRKSI